MALTLRYVSGVSPAKWLRTWSERRPDLAIDAARVEEPEQLSDLIAGEADIVFIRLPIDTEGMHAIPLWEELPVAVLPKDHPFADAESLSLADLDTEPQAPIQADAAMTIALVAAGTGYAIVPHGVARLHHRRDVVAIPVRDAPPTRIALVWRVDRDDADIQEFVGIVRGRTARSSRGTGDGDEEPDATKATPDPGRRGARRAASTRTSRTRRPSTGSGPRGGRGR